MSELPGGTLTVLHTDVEGSTLLTVHLLDGNTSLKNAFDI